MLVHLVLARIMILELLGLWAIGSSQTKISNFIYNDSEMSQLQNKISNFLCNDSWKYTFYLKKLLKLLEFLFSVIQGWLELASARHSMGASRINSTLFDLKSHRASTTLQVHQCDGIYYLESSVYVELCAFCWFKNLYVLEVMWSMWEVKCYSFIFIIHSSETWTLHKRIKKTELHKKAVFRGSIE